MSKTTIKQRIALVAIAALGGTVLSITSATTANATLAIGDLTQAGSSTGIVTAYSGSASTATMAADGVLAFNIASKTGAISVTGGKITGYNAGASTQPGTNNGLTITADGSGASWSALTIYDMQFKPTAAGTNMVIKVWAGTASAATTPSTAATLSLTAANLKQTITVTVVSSGAAGTFSAGKSYFSVNPLASGTATVADTAGENVVRNVEARINYTLVDALGTAGSANMPANTTVQAQVTSGSCLVNTSAGTATLPVVSETASSGDFYVSSTVYPVPANCTVVISVDGVVRSTKSFIFQGQPSKITFNGPSYTGKSSNTTAAPAGSGYITVQDSAGNNLGGISLSPDATTYGSIVNSATAVTTGSQINGYNASSVPSAITWACTSAGGATTVKYTTTLSTGASLSSDAIPVRCAKDANTYTASLDKASYAPGDIATLTISAKDSAGLAVNDAQVLGTSTANGPAILGSQLTAVTAPTYTDTFSGGVKTYKYVVGSTTGSYNLVVDLPYLNSISTAGQAAVTVAYKVASSSTDVTNADVLKSIVALIASINKQIQALQKLILRR